MDERPVLLLDTSVAIPLVFADHEDHAKAIGVVRGHRLGMAGHAWFETFSVLTRLPSGLRRSPADAFHVLQKDFPVSEFLDATEAADLGEELSRLDIAGGAVYDALVAAAARRSGLRLVSFDRRAASTYDALGVDVMLIDPLS
jgi:predicted nucleic acid-binding protein